MLDGFAINAAEVNGEVVTILSAEPGSYAIGGSAALLSYGRAIIADPGIYSISGSSSVFLRGYAIIAAQADYAVSGADAGRVRGYQLFAGQAGYALTGVDARLALGIFDPAIGRTFSIHHENRMFRVRAKLQLRLGQSSRVFRVPREDRTLRVSNPLQRTA